jgi:hypothetical protein
MLEHLIHVNTWFPKYEADLAEQTYYIVFVSSTLSSLSLRHDDRHCVELSFTGSPNSLIGVHVFESDAVLQGLNNELTKQRFIKHLFIDDENKQIEREQQLEDHSRSVDLREQCLDRVDGYSIVND